MTLIHNVKNLAIQVPISEKGCSFFVAQLLKCFPCLEALLVEVNFFFGDCRGNIMGALTFLSATDLFKVIVRAA